MSVRDSGWVKEGSVASPIGSGLSTTARLSAATKSEGEVKRQSAKRKWQNHRTDCNGPSKA